MATDEVKGFEEGLAILQAAEAELFGTEAEVNFIFTKKSKAKTDAGKARAAKAGLVVDPNA